MVHYYFPFWLNIWQGPFFKSKAVNTLTWINLTRGSTSTLTFPFYCLHYASSISGLLLFLPQVAPQGETLTVPEGTLGVRNACLAAFSLFPFHALQQKPFTVLGQLLAIPPLKVLPDPWPHDAAYTRSGFQSLVSRLWGSFISPQ